MGPPHAAQDSASSSPSGSGSGSSRRRFRRLDRRNASKNIAYDAANFCSYPPSPTPSSSSSAPASAACSLDLLSSFRIGGSGDGGGDLQLLCQSLGLSGPDDFAIPLADWEAHKAVRNSSASSSPSSARHNPNAPARDSPLRREGVEEEPAQPADTDPELPAAWNAPIEAPERPQQLDRVEPVRLEAKRAAGEGGIKGVRPPPVVLKPPPSIAMPAVCGAGSTWDILASFAPDEKERAPASRSRSAFERQEEDEDEDAAVALALEELRLGETSEDFTGTSSMSTVNDDETSSTTTESMFYISPNGRFRRKIRSWNRGVLLGSGSFGTVYEGISDEGVFFAVKEVSLYDQGKQCKAVYFFSLSRKFALLSQFEHENIVQVLWNRQKDIKCANILVHANGSVKLADFGLAKEITKFNAVKSCKGTVYWMAPEVVNPRKTYGPAADIWSLGCTVLEMLTCQLPYPDLEWTQALYRIGKGEPPAIPSVLSRDARDFISQCVKPNPDDRPSASKLLEHPFVNRSMHSIRSMRTSSRSNSSTRGIN
ncbi:hypothetical protein PR202_gb19311 [Eleusine coracana subsp. coracana]|uniref:mitogen-activated protein kinase kinase kinase n=1 Tax=Eleusine coracana subsp. coracana TaxID=191504 RepID=A0AAV5F7X5_ELECO|nr:hypothetical protein PR202_gb19311 [Eleusine coracana subsp. coracana]